MNTLEQSAPVAFGYRGKVALVTGGAAGIGEAVARRLAAEGASVVVGDIDEERLGRLAVELGDRCATSRCDAASEGDLEALVGLAAERFGGLDVAFNVAGTARVGPIVDLTEADWDVTVDVCQRGVFLSMKHEARLMIERGGGAIVNVASLAGAIPSYGAAAYGAAKAGIGMLTRVGALELGRHGIRVNAVAPGLTETGMTAGALGVPGVREAFLERIPLARAASPDEQASAMLFLGSEAAGYVTGVNLLVDGGWSQTGYPDMRPFMERSSDSFGRAHRDS